MQRQIGTALFAMTLTALQCLALPALAQSLPSPNAVPATPYHQLTPLPTPPVQAAAPAPAQSTPAPTVDAPSPAVSQTQTAAAAPVLQPTMPATLPHDLSPWGMFMAADIVVKAVMLGLAFASVVTWTIWLSKALELAGAKARASRANRALERSESLDQAGKAIAGPRGKANGPVALLVAAAQQERQRSLDLSDDGIKERVAISLSRIEARAGRKIAMGTGLLATIGSTAPFVGLFGTVWGIMNSFIGISQAKTTNLAVVAPGIAEALLATAIGLVAAIPAVIIYNVFARSIAGYRALLSDASGEVLRHLSRDLERGRAQITHGRTPLHAVPSQPAAAHGAVMAHAAE